MRRPDPRGSPRELPDWRRVDRPVIGEHSLVALVRSLETN
jgi:hypothetical protein